MRKDSQNRESLLKTSRSKVFQYFAPMLPLSVLGVFIVAGAIAPTSAYAEAETETTTTPIAVAELSEVNPGIDILGMDQVTSVSQLTDVRPTDWAFQALQSLVERYGCIAGYPDRSFRGNQAITRYEFAAGLNACLDRITQILAANSSDFVKKEDLDAIRRLQEEFSAELATLRGRVDALEARTTTLEKQQFSTTTKLFGQAIVGIQGRSAGDVTLAGFNFRDFDELAHWAETANVNSTTITLVGLALLAGPMGKCAQFPLHLWLDEAMEGPIPSTILRNSVVVATGAWVLIKLEPVLSLSPVVLVTMMAIGALTALGGTLIAIAQIDVKRALSYSVSAYMGLVFLAVATGQTDAALLLILSHALAQGLLVMSTGSIVLNNITQDLTQLGGLWSRRPVSGLCYLVGAAGLVGLPPLGGFWALLKLADGLWITQPWLVGLLLGVNGLTAFSLVRQFGLIFAGSSKQMTERSPESFWLITLPMVLLAGFTLHLPMILQSLSLLPSWAVLNKDVALLLLWSSVFGGGIGAVVYIGQAIPKPVELPWKPLQSFFAYDLYTPQLYRSSIVFCVDWASRLSDWFDRQIIDGAVNLVGLASVWPVATARNTSPM